MVSEDKRYKMDNIFKLADRFLAGDDVAGVLSAVEVEGAAKAALFGFLVANRLHRMNVGAPQMRLERDYALLCSRAGVPDDLRLLDGAGR